MSILELLDKKIDREKERYRRESYEIELGQRECPQDFIAQLQSIDHRLLVRKNAGTHKFEVWRRGTETDKPHRVMVCEDPDTHEYREPGEWLIETINHEFWLCSRFVEYVEQEQERVITERKREAGRATQDTKDAFIDGLTGSMMGKITDAMPHGLSDKMDILPAERLRVKRSEAIHKELWTP